MSYETLVYNQDMFYFAMALLAAIQLYVGYELRGRPLFNTYVNVMLVTVPVVGVLLWVM